MNAVFEHGIALLKIIQHNTKQANKLVIMAIYYKKTALVLRTCGAFINQVLPDSGILLAGFRGCRYLKPKLVHVL